MLTKKKVLATLKDLPEKFSSEDLIDRIILLDKIEVGLNQSKNGKTYSLKQIETKLKKFLN